MTIQQQTNKTYSSKLAAPFELILFNDEIHTFEFVIEQLVKHCRHSDEQAEQCALIAHERGDCSILRGTEQEIEEAAEKLSAEGLTVDVRKVPA